MLKLFLNTSSHSSMALCSINGHLGGFSFLIKLLFKSVSPRPDELSPHILPESSDRNLSFLCSHKSTAAIPPGNFTSHPTPERLSQYNMARHQAAYWTPCVCCPPLCEKQPQDSLKCMQNLSVSGSYYVLTTSYHSHVRSKSKSH